MMTETPVALSRRLAVYKMARGWNAFDLCYGPPGEECKTAGWPGGEMEDKGYRLLGVLKLLISPDTSGRY